MRVVMRIIRRPRQDDQNCVALALTYVVASASVRIGETWLSRVDVHYNAVSVLSRNHPPTPVEISESYQYAMSCSTNL
jgi:hypothetical protein